MIRLSFVLLSMLFVYVIATGQSISKNISPNSIDQLNSETIKSKWDTNSVVKNLQISLLTLTPGADLYSVFGHSAIRVKDPNIGTDIVYNYGTFDFSDPNFLPKFIRGELDYFISQETYEEFIYFYNSEGRGLHEQVLNLSENQKSGIQKFLFWNMEQENRFYRYNFLYNNCTTKLRDIINQYRDTNIKTENLTTTKGMSFRDGLHYYLDRSNQQWVKLGIDIILGSRIDKKMDNYESQFLPDFLEEGLDKTKVNDQNFVIRKFNILATTITPQKNSIFHPIIIFSLLLIFYMGLIFFKSKISTVLISFIDIVLFAVSGLIGAILIFLWMYTLHEQSKENFNILWAWPTHMIAIFFYGRKNKLVKNYFLLTAFIMLATILFWFLLPQQLNISLIPIMLIMIISGFRYYKK